MIASHSTIEVLTSLLYPAIIYTLLPWFVTSMSCIKFSWNQIILICGAFPEWRRVPHPHSKLFVETRLAIFSLKRWFKNKSHSRTQFFNPKFFHLLSFYQWFSGSQLFLHLPQGLLLSAPTQWLHLFYPAYIKCSHKYQ